MKTLFESLLAMSLSGTVPFLIYLLVRKSKRLSLTPAFQYRILKLCLFLYLVPLSLFKELLPFWLNPESRKLKFGYTYLAHTLMYTNHGFQFHTPAFSPNYIYYIWGGALLIVLIGFMLYYFRFRQRTTHELIPDSSYNEELLRQKESLQIRRKVTLFYCDAPVSPFTYGFFRPCIVLTSLVDKEDASLAIRHELCHIKSRDFLVRSAAACAIALHFFNPCIYLLWNEIDRMQELICDSNTVQNASSRQICSYGKLLLNIGSTSEKSAGFSLSFAKKRKSFLEQRIFSLLTPKSAMRPVAAAAFSLICLSGAAVAVAACEPTIVDMRSKEGYSYDADSLNRTTWISLEWGEADLDVPEDERYFQQADQYLLFEDGTVLLCSPADAAVQAVCSHSWKPATLKDHEANSAGGCTVTTYSVKACTKCGETSNETRLSKITYDFCPH